MPRVALTDRFVAGVKQTTGQRDYFDAHVRGLVLRVADSGLKTWCAFYTSPKNGKRTRATLGRYPELGLADARGRALEARAHLEQGTDPRDVHHGSMTVAMLATSYLTKRASGLRSVENIRHRLERKALPLIGGIELGKLHRRDINRVLDAIMARGKPQEALAVFKVLRAMLRWAVERGDLEASPMQGMKGPAAPSVRDRILSEAEIRAAWKLEGDLGDLIKLCLLTAQRSGEVCGMQGEELDLKARNWIIPSSRTKNKTLHTVPLSDAALEIIRPRLRGGQLFDVGSSSRVSKALARAELGDWTMHDLRRTAISGMAELGVSPIVLAHIANHISATRAGVTLRVYQTYGYDREQRQALDLWADRLAGIVAGAARIVPIRA